MTGAPAYVRNGRLDILATNPLGRALYSPVFDDPRRPANIARFIFLDPRAREFYPDWERRRRRHRRACCAPRPAATRTTGG